MANALAQRLILVMLTGAAGIEAATQRIAVPFSMADASASFTLSNNTPPHNSQLRKPLAFSFPANFPIDTSLCSNWESSRGRCRPVEARITVAFDPVSLSVSLTNNPTLFSAINVSQRLEVQLPFNAEIVHMLQGTNFTCRDRAGCRTTLNPQPQTRTLSPVFFRSIDSPTRPAFVFYFSGSKLDNPPGVQSRAEVSLGAKVTGEVVFEVEGGPETQAPTVTLLDPAPSLLNGTSITTDTAKLASGGRIVDGVAADGTAQLVIRITGVTAGELLRIRLPGAAGPNLEGVLRTIGSLTESSLITVPVESTADGPMAFAIYHAPTDYSDGVQHTSGHERTITLQIARVSSASQGVAVTPVKVIRPTVILVHGLWDSGTVWSGFTPLLSDTSFEKYIFDYKETNAESFLLNAQQLAERLFSLRVQIATDKKIAVGQFDFVAHSMGGNIVRTLERTRLSRTSWNYRKGYVHKLITLGTPHLGSPLARELIKRENTCVAEAFTLVGRKVISTGAIGDLAGNGDGTGRSAALSALSSVRSAMLAGHLGPSQFIGIPPNFRRKINEYFCGTATPAPLVASFTPNNYRELMGGGHDGIVPVTSALNNQSWPDDHTWGGDGPATIGPWHSFKTSLLYGFNITGITGEPWLVQGDTEFADKAVHLLNTPVSSMEFK